MYFCLRIDLDYVPWDTPDAAEFGHGEPAVFLRLLELARANGLAFHFFASNRALRALPAEAEAALNEGHALDWLCKHPAEPERRIEADKLFAQIGNKPQGLAVKGAWPDEGDLAIVEGLSFISSQPGPAPPGLRHFPVDTRQVREAFRSGLSLRTWTDSLRTRIRESASLGTSVTVTIRPQVLAKYDPKLFHLGEVINLASAVGLEVKTLRQVMRD